MTLDALAASIDRTLRPLGFRRRKTAWNRTVESFVDVVTLQSSKSADDVAVNIGVLSPSVFKLCWGEDPQSFVEEPDCTVQSRLGWLATGKELWWRIDDQQAAQEIAEHLALEGVPFMQRMHSAGAMYQFLVDTKVADRAYPPPVIYLAILQHDRGERSSACDLLRGLRARTSDAWQARVDQAIARLSCGSATS